MRVIDMRGETDWDGWRAAARALVLAGTPPDTLRWTVNPAAAAPPPHAEGRFGVPRTLVALAAQAIQARDPERFALLYRLVWRANAGEAVMEDRDDPDLAQARALALAVRAEAHRMRALLRYLPAADGARLLGWYAPAHFVLEANAQLLARWYPGFAVSILTPDGSAHWDRTGDDTRLRFGPVVDPALVPDDAALRAYWSEFGTDLLAASTAGTSLPEAEAFEEARRPPDRPALGPVVPGGYGATDSALDTAAREAASCRRCPLGGPATQTVFGEGPAGARVMFIGEQAGDQEDVIGRPFVGPAGQLLDRALEEAGIDRRAVWISNAVKHFKFIERGRRRLHQTPQAPEIEACRFWLDVERVRLRPALLVLLGATAARAVLGRPVTIGRERGRPIRLSEHETALVTVHPSFLLRVPDEAARTREYAAFVADLRVAAGLGAAPSA
ncbi:MAG TPA: UdgX family uracil-DNA binding protein [Acetobacteraceae bacterium]|nr:UdgX family uracil-DNA binding protein [Acetobacteraceae bacterium]